MRGHVSDLLVHLQEETGYGINFNYTLYYIIYRKLTEEQYYEICLFHQQCDLPLGLTNYVKILLNLEEVV